MGALPEELVRVILLYTTVATKHILYNTSKMFKNCKQHQRPHCKAALKLEDIISSLSLIKWTLQEENGMSYLWQPNDTKHPKYCVNMYYRHICNMAATHGQLSVLKWAREHNYPWDAWVRVNAFMGGHIDVLNWAKKNGCPRFDPYIDEDADMICLLYRGDIKIFRYDEDDEYPIFEGVDNDPPEYSDSESD